MQKNSIAKDIIVAVAGAAVGAVVTALITNNLMVTICFFKQSGHAFADPFCTSRFG